MEKYKENHDDLILKLRQLQAENKNLFSQNQEIYEIKQSYSKLQVSNNRNEKINTYAILTDDILLVEMQEFIVEKAMEIFDIKYAIYINYDKEHNELAFRKTKLPEGFIPTLRKLSGINLKEHRTIFNNDFNNFVLKQKTQRFDSLHAMSMGMISSSVGKMIQRLFGIAWFQPVALVSKGDFLGFLILIGEKGQPPASSEELLTFSNISANALRRKHAHNHLIQQDSQLKEIINNLPDMFFMVDKNGYYKDFHANKLNLFPYNYKNTDLQNLAAVYPQKQYNDLIDLFEKCRKEGKLQIYEYPLEINNLTHYFEARIIPLNSSDIFMIVRDISHCKEIEIALRENLAKVQAMMEDTNEYVWAWSIANKQIYTNKKLRDLLKVLLKFELKNDSDILNLIPAELKGTWLKRVENVIKNGTKVFEDEIILNNQHRYFETSVSTINLDDQIMGVTFISRDITERKHNASLEKELILAHRTEQLKRNFLANLSHEMRTPLMGIIGIADILSHTALDEAQQEYVDILLQSGENMHSVVETLIDYANIEMKKIELQQDVFPLRTLVEKCLTEASSLSQKDIVFSIDYQDDIPEVIISDKIRLSLIIGNLLSNSEKFTKKGEVIVRVGKENSTWANLNKNKTENYPILLKIEVIDTGIGLTEEEKKQLFKPFCNFENHFSRESDGTGLGLAVCKGLIQLMGGDIGVSSIPGKGSQFWFTFKAEITADQMRIRKKDESHT